MNTTNSSTFNIEMIKELIQEQFLMLSANTYLPKALGDISNKLFASCMDIASSVPVDDEGHIPVVQCKDESKKKVLEDYSKMHFVAPTYPENSPEYFTAEYFQQCELLYQLRKITDGIILPVY